MPRIEVQPGVAIYSEVVGDGPPVALLHGWAFDHRVWERQVRVLAEAGFSSYALDLRGHGRSDKPYGDYSLGRLAADVSTVLAELCATPPVIVGWSLGGVTSFRIAVDEPDGIRGLVLVGSNGVATSRQDGYPFGAAPDDFAPALIAAELADRRTSRRRLLRNAFAEDPGERLIEDLLQMTLETPSWSSAASLSTLLYADQVAEVGRLAVPVHQIIGQADPVFSARGAAWLLDAVPALQQTILTGCGHFPMVEAPDEFDAALLTAVRAIVAD